MIFNNSGSNVYANNFNVSLNNGMAGAISFSGNSSFGNFNLQASTTQNILINISAALSSVDGNITLQGNAQGATATGNFTAVTVNGTVRSTGSGVITVQGQGFSTSSQVFGVLVGSGGAIRGRYGQHGGCGHRRFRDRRQ